MFTGVRVIPVCSGANEGLPEEAMSIEGYLYKVPSSA